jgi:ABC-type transport system substrate-binding protein
LKRPQPDFLVPLASREVFLYPIEIADSEMMSTGSDFIGTGPMILTDVRKGERVTFKQNPEYWGNKPLLDGMEYHVIPDSAAQLAAFRAGQVDYVSNMIGNPGQAEALLDSNPDSQLHLQAAFYAAFSLALNLENPKFQDERVRRALNMAVNRQAMIDILYQGLAKPVSTMAWNFLFDDEPTPEQMGRWWRHDPAEARRMLEAAGAQDLEFEMVYYTYNIVENKNADELLVDHLRQVGVTVNLAQLDVTSFNAQWGQKQYREAADGWPATGWEADTFFRNHLKSGSTVNRWNIRCRSSAPATSRRGARTSGSPSDRPAPYSRSRPSKWMWRWAKSQRPSTLRRVSS